MQQSHLQESTRVILEVYNVFGKKIKLITDEIQDEGYYTYRFSTRESDHQPRRYLVRLGDKMFTQRLVEFK